MAESTLRGILILALLGLVPGVFPPPAHAQTETPKDEVIIEGRDQQPSRSSFDYLDTGGDTPNYSAIGTKDAPEPAGPSPFKEPRLDRDTGPMTHAELNRPTTTAVNEFSTTELFLMGVGIMAVLAVL